MVLGINTLLVLVMVRHSDTQNVAGIGTAALFLGAGAAGQFLATVITPAAVAPMGPLPHGQRGVGARGGVPARRRGAAVADDGGVRVPAGRGRAGGQAVRRHRHADRRRRRATRPCVRRAGLAVLDFVHRRHDRRGGRHPRRRPTRTDSSLPGPRSTWPALRCTPSSAAARAPRAKVCRMATAAPIVDDLRAESDALDALVADLPAAHWAEATPAPGWTIAHQIAHLLWTDRVSLSVGQRRGRLRRSARRRRREPERLRRPRRRRDRRRRTRRAAGRLASTPGTGCTTRC